MAVFPHFGKALVYIETNERGLEAARYAIACAKRTGGELHAVAVVNERILEELTKARVFLKEEGLDLRRDVEEDGKRYLALVQRLAHEKEVRVTTELLHGVVHREILDKAREINASIIILGEIEESLSRRDTTFNESERVLCDARCPVLIVKGRRLVKDFFDSA